MELRCENGIKFGEITGGLLEVKCRSSRCGHGIDGVVVIHRFDPLNGELLETRRFKDPATGRKERV